jgi:hypothetical protein
MAQVHLFVIIGRDRRLLKAYAPRDVQGSRFNVQGLSSGAVAEGSRLINLPFTAIAASIARSL